MYNQCDLSHTFYEHLYFVLFFGTAHKYHSREEFLNDIQLLVTNCRAYNGLDSQFTRQAEAILKVTQEALEQVTLPSCLSQAIDA